jgi:hypothetical protein
MIGVVLLAAWGRAIFKRLEIIKQDKDYLYYCLELGKKTDLDLKKQQIQPF